MAYQYDFPVVLANSGAQPTPPATLLAQLLAYVAATNPGYTATLPGSLIEDISSTDVGALALIDAARVELINSLTPYGANSYLLNQLGQIYGLTLGSATNTSVGVVFSGTVGYVIPAGFLVGDGTYTYQVQGGGVIGSGGSSASITAVAIQQGSWSISIGAVTQLLTSVPSNVTLTVTNPAVGTPGSTAETEEAFRSRVLQAGLAASVGTARYIKTLVSQTGVPGNLISVQQASPGIRVVVGGTYDQYQVAYAIFSAIADPSDLVGKASGGTNVTVSLYDYPDTYSIEYVNAVVQTFTATATWNTTLSSFTGGGAFAGLVQAPIAAYINSLAIGQVVNILELNNIFQNAIAGVLDPSNLTRLAWTLYINGTMVSPGSGESYIAGDTEGYFTCSPSGITVTQG